MPSARQPSDVAMPFLPAVISAARRYSRSGLHCRPTFSDINATSKKLLANSLWREGACTPPQRWGSSTWVNC